MATSTTTLNPSAGTTSSSVPWMKIALPYAIAILSQLPMLLIYFRDLWGLPHYRFFPFSVLATIGFAYLRWPRDIASPFNRSWLSDLLLFGGLFCGMITVIFSAQWFAALSVMLLVASLLARTTDGETLGSLGAASLPFFTCLMLPLRMDTRLIVWLQNVSSSVTSMILDLVGLKHFKDGVVIKVPGTEGYGVEEMCSGVQSFFTLFFFAILLIVYFRRSHSSILQFVVGVCLAVLAVVIGSVTASPVIGWLAGLTCLFYGLLGLRSSLLILAAVVWAIFMNTVRIVTIPIAQEWFGVDLVHGIKHDLLGYAVLVAGILLLFSTDQLVQFILGPQDPEGGFFAKFGKSAGKTKSKKKRRRSISKASSALIWSTAILLGLCGIAQLALVGSALASPRNKLSFFDPNVTVPFEEGDVPSEIANWRKVDYVHEMRNRSSDFGLRSDGWQFRAPRCAPYVSFDQTFPGWHELTTCYRNGGWELIKRRRVDPDAALVSRSGGHEWPYIEATFKKETGEHAFLLFSIFDARGESVDPPASWGGLGSYLIRLRGRIAHKWRSALFQSEAYQTQVFVQTFGPISDDLRLEVRDRYLVVREAIRTRFMEKQGVTPKASPVSTNRSDSTSSNSSGDVFGDSTKDATDGSSDFPF